MLLIPLAAVPAQTFALTLAGQPVQISLRTLGTSLYFSLEMSGESIVRERICRNRQRLLVDAEYRGFIGDFSFKDTQGDTDPTASGLGARYVLVYLDADE